MKPRLFRIPDDRGVRHRPEASERLRRTAHRRVHTGVWTVERQHRRLVFAAVLPAFLPLLALSAVRIFWEVVYGAESPVPTWLDNVAVAFLLVWMPLIGAVQHGMYDEAKRRLLLCPCCHYDLTGARVEPDGCSVCAECGAAWRLADAQEPSRVSG